MTHHKRLAIFGLAIAFLLPMLGALGPKFMPAGAAAGAVMLSATPWFVLFWVRFAEQRPWDSIGFRRPTSMTFALGIFGVAANLAISVITAAIEQKCGVHEPTSAFVTSLRAHAPWALILLITNGAVLTEICFRGYALERLAELFGDRFRPAIAVQIILTVLLFAGSRGVAHGIVWLCDDIAFCAIYVWRRDTTICLTSHVIPNATAATLFALGFAS